MTLATRGVSGFEAGLLGPWIKSACNQAVFVFLLESNLKIYYDQQYRCLLCVL